MSISSDVLSFCDPDFYPIAQADEGLLAGIHLAAIRADAPTYGAIVAHLGIDPSATPTASQVLAIYRDWKTLRAIELTDAGGAFGFGYIAAGANGQSASHVVGTIDAAGTISVESRAPSGPPLCPICLARGTRIATPTGERLVEDLRPGMAVWTADSSGLRIAASILAVGSTPVPTTHRVVHLVLSDGRSVDVSPGHRLPDGRRAGDLRPGEPVDGSTVASAGLQGTTAVRPSTFSPPDPRARTGRTVSCSRARSASRPSPSIFLLTGAPPGRRVTPVAIGGSPRARDRSS